MMDSASLPPLGLAFLMGALHSLEPGHGKSVMAAALIGTGARPLHALVLATVMSLAHTVSVLALGLLVSRAFGRWSLERIEQTVTLVSALLVCGVGVWMWMTHGPKSHRHLHEHLTIEAPTENRSLKQLVLLGISGGVIPCPHGVSLVLGAFALGQIAHAFTLVVFFSLGVGVVVVVVALAFSRFGKVVERVSRRYERLSAALPRVSAGLVCGIGGYLLLGALQDFGVL